MLTLRCLYLRVSSHDLAGLLVDGLTVPLGVHALQHTGQAVVLAYKQRVDGSQGGVFIHTHVT